MLCGRDIIQFLEENDANLDPALDAGEIYFTCLRLIVIDRQNIQARECFKDSVTRPTQF